jgi:hypothetical protein
MPEEIWKQAHIIHWSQILLNSYEQRLKSSLIERKSEPLEQAKALFLAPFVIVSHGTQHDPILNYGNQMALKLWEMNWNDLINTPSRLTAEPVEQQEREEMLARAAKYGYIDDYSGIRISKSGKRFSIEEAIIWNLSDTQEQKCGQAATFSKWSFIA